MAMGLVVVLGGCGTVQPEIDFYDTDSATLRRFEAMEVTSSTNPPSTGYQDLGAVEGRYCKSHYALAPVDDPVAHAQAMDQVMLNAALLGASHITTPICEISVKPSCLTCNGHALRFQGE